MSGWDVHKVALSRLMPHLISGAQLDSLTVTAPPTQEGHDTLPTSVVAYNILLWRPLELWWDVSSYSNVGI